MKLRKEGAGTQRGDASRREADERKQLLAKAAEVVEDTRFGSKLIEYEYDDKRKAKSVLDCDSRPKAITGAQEQLLQHIVSRHAAVVRANESLDGGLREQTTQLFKSSSAAAEKAYAEAEGQSSIRAQISRHRNNMNTAVEEMQEGRYLQKAHMRAAYLAIDFMRPRFDVGKLAGEYNDIHDRLSGSDETKPIAWYPLRGTQR